jgi:hypothetical protein
MAPGVENVLIGEDVVRYDEIADALCILLLRGHGLSPH